MLAPLLALQGVLVTYQAGHPIGRESFSDDGKVLRSELELGGQRAVVVVSRAPRKVLLVAGGQAKETAVPAGTIVLENGSWQEYALAAEWSGAGEQPTKVQVLIPAQGKTLEGTLAVKRGAGGARTIDATVQSVHVVVELDAHGAVKSARVPSQSVEVRRDGEPPPGVERRAPPAGVVEEEFSVARPDVVLRGVVWRPAHAGKKTPIALIIAGSGPTDRDCNSALGIKTDAYRMLAEGLAKRGIASARYDKRGVGASQGSFDMARTTIADFTDDALAVLADLRQRAPAAEVTLVGHSEGGLIAILAAGRAKVDRLVLLETAGRTLGKLLREQIGKEATPVQLAELERVLAALAAGRPLDPIQPPIDKLFPPIVRTFLASEVTLDPLPPFSKLTTPTLIVQGESDAQVTLTDGKLLAAARPAAKLAIIPEMNHVLKREATAKLPQASYTDPKLPLAPKLVEAVAGAIRAAR